LVGLLDPLLYVVVVVFLLEEDDCIGIDYFFDAEDKGNPPSLCIFYLYS
jgi:hypothetical protein